MSNTIQFYQDNPHPCSYLEDQDARNIYPDPNLEMTNQVSDVVVIFHIDLIAKTATSVCRYASTQNYSKQTEVSDAVLIVIKMSRLPLNQLNLIPSTINSIVTI